MMPSINRMTPYLIKLPLRSERWLEGRVLVACGGKISSALATAAELDLLDRRRVRFAQASPSRLSHSQVAV